ncbi:MAG: N-acetylmuramoyl-L-alanine amidase [Sulfurimonas sp.]|jgi:N-acetylmuramoyl-L-alanine amidase
MIRLVLLALLFALSLHALSDNETINRANSLMKSGSKTNIFSAYNDYKSIYLRSVMSDDNKLKAVSLEGIIKSGTALKIDVSGYKQDLEMLNPHEQTKKSYNSSTAQVKLVEKHKENKNIEIKSINKLQNAKFEEDALVLEFDKELDSSQIHSVTSYDAKTKQHKYTFDIYNSMLIKSKELRKAGINKIKLTQNKGDALQLVIENSKKLALNFTVEANKVIINIGAETSDKTVKNTVKPSHLNKNKVIVLDSGHGGHDPGATGYKGYKEKTIVFQIAKELRNILKSRGYKVHMTRDSDDFVKLSDRTKFANKKNADIFVSIHANAVEKSNADKATGLECYFLSKSRSDRAKRVASSENSADMSDMNFYGKESFLNTINSHNIIASNKLAIDLQGGMLGSLKKSYDDVTDAGVREGPFWVLVGAQMPSVLVEVGFISHPKEGARLVSLAYQKSLALGMADGIERYFINN